MEAATVARKLSVAMIIGVRTIEAAVVMPNPILTNDVSDNEIGMVMPPNA